MYVYQIYHVEGYNGSIQAYGYQGNTMEKYMKMLLNDRTKQFLQIGVVWKHCLRRFQEYDNLMTILTSDYEFVGACIAYVQ